MSPEKLQIISPTQLRPPQVFGLSRTQFDICYILSYQELQMTSSSSRNQEPVMLLWPNLHPQPLFESVPGCEIFADMSHLLQRSKTSLFKQDFVRCDLKGHHKCIQPAVLFIWMLIARLTLDNSGKEGAFAVAWSRCCLKARTVTAREPIVVSAQLYDPQHLKLFLAHESSMSLLPLSELSVMQKASLLISICLVLKTRLGSGCYSSPVHRL